MSWLKRLLSSYNVELDPALEGYALEITKDMINNWSRIEAGIPELKYSLEYINKYTKEGGSINFSFGRNSDPDEVGYYNYDNETVYLFPENLIHKKRISGFDDPKAVKEISGCIIHEITHSVDPFLKLKWFPAKMEEIEKQQRLGSDDAYYNSWHEFDGYSKQLSYELNTYAQKSEENRARVKKMLTEWDMKDLEKIVGIGYKDFIDTISNSPKLRTLKQRLFNELRF